MTYFKIALFSLLLTYGVAHAHGMNALGPNGGYIKMPGDFHTELIETKDLFHLYLLDMKFQNPTVQNSAVNISYNSSPAVKCEAGKNNFFICLKPKNGMESIKTITLSIKRKSGQPRSAVYQWPLKL